MTLTLDRPDFSALDRYAERLVEEIRSDYDRYGLDLSFIPCAVSDDIGRLVSAEAAADPTIFGYVTGYVSAKVVAAF
jgi:hypothetical protein